MFQDATQFLATSFANSQPLSLTPARSVGGGRSFSRTRMPGSVLLSSSNLRGSLFRPESAVADLPTENPSLMRMFTVATLAYDALNHHHKQQYQSLRKYVQQSRND